MITKHLYDAITHATQGPNGEAFSDDLQKAVSDGRNVDPNSTVYKRAMASRVNADGNSQSNSVKNPLAFFKSHIQSSENTGDGDNSNPPSNPTI